MKCLRPHYTTRRRRYQGFWTYRTNRGRDQVRGTKPRETLPPFRLPWYRQHYFVPGSASLPDPRAGTDVEHLPVSPLLTRTFVQDVGHRSDIVLHSLDDLQGAVLDIESSFLPVICRSDLSTRSDHTCESLIRYETDSPHIHRSQLGRSFHHPLFVSPRVINDSPL
jgi:hypothetical protein